MAAARAQSNLTMMLVYQIHVEPAAEGEYSYICFYINLSISVTPPDQTKNHSNLEFGAILPSHKYY